jgi:hypothetical protein
MRLRTKIWLVLLLIAVAVVAAILFLPWWLSLALIFILLLPIWIAIAVFVMLKAASKQIGKEINSAIGRQESRRSLKAGENFQGNGFSFTFPVACQVTQTVIADFEAIVLKPQLHARREPGASLLIISTMSKSEMKTTATEKIDEVFTKIDEVNVSQFAPLQVGSLSGEYRMFEASKDGKSLRGESAYLGDNSYSVAWQIITARDSFEPVAAKYRELAGLIQRASERTSK